MRQRVCWLLRQCGRKGLGGGRVVVVVAMVGGGCEVRLSVGSGGCCVPQLVSRQET